MCQTRPCQPVCFATRAGGIVSSSIGINVVDAYANVGTSTSVQLNQRINKSELPRRDGGDGRAGLLMSLNYMRTKLHIIYIKLLILNVSFKTKSARPSGKRALIFIAAYSLIPYCCAGFKLFELWDYVYVHTDSNQQATCSAIHDKAQRFMLLNVNDHCRADTVLQLFLFFMT